MGKPINPIIITNIANPIHQTNNVINALVNEIKNQKLTCLSFFPKKNHNTPMENGTNSIVVSFIT